MKDPVSKNKVDGIPKERMTCQGCSRASTNKPTPTYTQEHTKQNKAKPANRTDKGCWSLELHPAGGRGKRVVLCQMAMRADKDG